MTDFPALPPRLPPPRGNPRAGMTLVEMMVATTMTLIIMGIVAQLFGVLGKTVTGSRSTMDLSSRLRAVANTLRQDLAGVTVQTVPPVAADSDSGYLEIIEGPITDTSLGVNQIIGDGDDVLMFTTKAPQQPFVGVFAATASLESPVAEVAWFCKRSAMLTNGLYLYTLYRRQLLVMGYVGAAPFTTGANRMVGSLPMAWQDYDLSLRQDGTTLLPNSLGDLSKRENRFMHFFTGTTSAANFPYNLTATTLADLSSASGTLTGGRLGQDVVLDNVLAFDVKVFDPAVVIRSVGTIEVTPDDPGYATGSVPPAPAPVPTGAYVDLGSTLLVPLTPLTKAADARSKLSRVYDTWSTHYEFNGIDEDLDGIVDEGTDGFDSNGDGVVDDAGERETSPPYTVPLRGIEIRIRAYEPSSRQIRQVTVRHTFVPH